MVDDQKETIKLNEGQLETVDLCSLWINDLDIEFDHRWKTAKYKAGKLIINDWLCIRGAGGSGKTSVTNWIIDTYKKDKSNILCATLSHAAKEILQSKITHNEVEVKTLASICGLKPRLKRNGEIEFVKDYNNQDIIHPVETCDILIIDEASMLGPFFINIINKLKKSNCKVLCLMDKFQLPPIDPALKKGEDSPICDYWGFELTKIERYGGHIETLCNSIRQSILENKVLFKPLLNESESISLIRDSQIIDLAVEHFKQEPENLKYFRCIAYRNNTCNTYNQKIKTQLFGSDKYVPGVQIIFNDAYETIKKKSIQNGQMFIVESVQECYVSRREIKGFQLRVFNPHNKESHTIIAIDDYEHYNSVIEEYIHIANMSKEEYQTQFDYLKQYGWHPYRQRWNYYFEVKHIFANISYNYVISAYKVQGSTIKQGVVMAHDIFGVKPITLKQKLQAFYVGCSRFEEKLYICKK